MAGSDEHQSHPSESNQSESHQPVEEAPVTKAAPKPKLSIGVLVFSICVFAAFILAIAGIAIGMMDSRDSKACISIWGYKPKCLGTWFRTIKWEEFGNAEDPDGYCKKGDSLMKGAQAFSVMSVIGGFLTVFVALLELFHYAELAVVACIIASIGMVATLVTWSTMLAMYWSNLCGQGVYADTYKMGNGLILFITAWCLQMVGILVLIVDVYRGNAK